jgi:DNA-binding beta-propeller fold protein YncE
MCNFHLRQLLAGILLAVTLWSANEVRSEELQRLLYVAEPGIRNYLEYGGHGVIVFDIDHDYTFVKRIAFEGLAPDGTPANVKGICGNAATGRLYVSTIIHLICIDLHNDKVLWQRAYPNGCDRMSMSPDGKVIYQPSFEKDNWYVLDAISGDVIAEIAPKSRAHNTVYAIDGSRVYLAGLASNLLSIADTSSHKLVAPCGPFSQSIRPFTVNGSQTLCFVNVNDCLGFEVGDLKTGKKIHRVEVAGFEQGPVKRHGCPSHGIGLTPDESEIWISDAHNEHVHVFDARQMPPTQVQSIKVREQPGWITFSIDGKTCLPSTGDVIDVASRKITHTLTDEEGRMVMSEKLLEVQWQGSKIIAVGDQFGRGAKTNAE